MKKAITIKIFILLAVIRLISAKATIAQAKKYKYVPDEIIVKLKDNTQANVSITSNAQSNILTGLASLDKLHKKHGVHKMQRILGKTKKKNIRLLKTEAKIKNIADKIANLQSQKALSPTQQQKLQDLSDRHKKLLSKKDILLEKLGKFEEKRQKLLNLYLLKLKQGSKIEQVISEYQKDPNVEYAEPNFIYGYNLTTPNDSYFSEMWGLHNFGQIKNWGQPNSTIDADIDMPEAWDITTGNKDIVVAVIDSGVDYNHYDLDENMWVNTDEIPGNGKDDDSNGYIDDIHGINAINGSGNPMDDHGHGTHCSGTIGAEGNNAYGITGVNWQVSIMALKFISADGYGKTSDAITCIDYAIANGAHILSNSWGGGGYSRTLKGAIAAANIAGTLFIAAAGNSGNNNDAYSNYPSSYDNENIVAVAATDYYDNLASFSCYGKNSVDVAAPGVKILSCLPGNSYGHMSGTSMATPHVAGLAALIWAAYGQTIDYMEVKAQIMRTVDNVSTLNGKVLTEGRINAHRALTESIVGPYIYSTNVKVGTVGTHVIIFGVNFGGTQGLLSQVIFPNGIEAPIISWSDNQIRCVVPNGTTSGNITVTTEEGSSNSKSFTLIIPTTRYVPHNYVTIQSAIDAAFDGDTVLVDDGIYSEKIDFKGKAITVKSVNGAAVTSISSESYAWSSRVTFNSGEGSGSVLDGFTVANGHGAYLSNIFIDGVLYSGWLSAGGGIHCGEYSSPHITNCIIKDNIALIGGGIFCNWGSSPTITNCIITNNHVHRWGGGIFCHYGSAAIISNCDINQNETDATGPRYTQRGAGICIYSLPSQDYPAISNCLISDNLAWGRGAIFMSQSFPIINNCVFKKNPIAIYCDNLSSPEIVNATIISNGYSIYAQNNSSPKVTNSIIWGNLWELFSDSGSQIDIEYSDIQGGYPGTNNIDADPLFLSSGDYHIASNSPCVDAGTSDQEAAPNIPGNDIDGDTRPIGPAYDMGADESTCARPFYPSNPSPSNETGGVNPELYVTLDWDNDITAVSYDVYLGSSNPPTVSICTNTTDSSCNFPGDLVCGATYYWKVVAKNLCGETEGEVWRFTVMGETEDCDEDGMPNDWELANELYPYDPNDANEDPDEDGHTNLTEYQNNWNPRHKPVTYYVDAGNDTGVEDGSKAHPFDTIEEALPPVGPAEADDTVRVAAGNYLPTSDLVIPEGVKLIGKGWYLCSIDLGKAYQIQLNSYSTLTGFKINNCASQYTIFVQNASSVTITNNVIMLYPALPDSNGIFLDHSSGRIENNIIEGLGLDSLIPSSIGIYTKSAFNTNITNNIVFRTINALMDTDNSSLSVDYNNLWNNFNNYASVTPGANDRYNDPQFVDQDNGNFHLKHTSPCRNSGNPDPTYNDKDGSRNDIGADGGPGGTMDTTVPAASASATPMDSGVSTQVQFIDNSSDEWGIASRSWDFDSLDGIQQDSTLQNPTHTYSSCGNYIVTLTVTDHSGLSSSSAIESINVDNPTTVSVSATPNFGVATEDTISFSCTVDGPSTYLYSWDFGDGDTSSEQNPDHIYDTPGAYTATLTVTDNVGGCQTPATVPVTIVDGACNPTPLGNQVINSSGGTVTGGNVEVNIPANALPNPTVITIHELDDSLIPSFPPGISALGVAIDFGPDGCNFSLPVTVTIPYTDADLGITDPYDLKLYYYDTDTNTWTEIEVTEVDTVNKLIYAETDHFTLYTLAAGAPTPPTGLTATAVSSSQINLSWTDNSSNEDGFRIERKTGSGTYTEIGTVASNTTSYQDTGLAPGTEYCYRVMAYKGTDYAGYSNESCATTQPSGILSNETQAAGGGGGGGSGGGGGGCFIATAAYGTPLAGQVKILSEFRDEYLLSNSLGRKFVNLYYKYSPPIARYISQNRFLRLIVRIMLWPLIIFSLFMLRFGLLEKVGILTVLFIITPLLIRPYFRGKYKSQNKESLQ